MDFVTWIIIASVLLFLVIVVILFLYIIRSSGPDLFHPVDEQKQAGIDGEEAARKAIKSILREDDILLNNINVEFEGKHTEIDNLIVNKYGIFIIEVKNYSGQLIGKEDDFEWQKVKITDAGNVYEKTVKNPIVQVKRQIYILAGHLRHYDINVWIRGYSILLNNNSPVKNDSILTSLNDIDRVTHIRESNGLGKKTIEKVLFLLGQS